jgi:DNA-binding NarL/FixJ family response regulator
MVVDDSLLPRVAARALINASSVFRLVGEAASGEEALQVVAGLGADLALVDVNMPGMDGPTTTRAILARHPELKVVAWTVSDSSDDLLAMMRAGCAGYVLKDAGPSELERALMAAIRSESPLPRKMIPAVIRRAAERAPVPRIGTVSLTPRETQVLRGIAKGHTSKRLSQDIGIKVPSVESHLKNLFRKLGATNRGEAVSAALKAGLITLEDL